jgi:hypothetical protein
MYFKPLPLGASTLEAQTLRIDKQACKHYGPCGVGQKALYLNSFFIDRRYYLPISSVTRVYKRIAMSKGGFSGKGMFASIPYLVVEYDGGKEKQCNFKYEENVDLLLACLQKMHPQIKTVSAAAEQRLAQAAAEQAARDAKLRAALTPERQALADELKRQRAFLQQQPELGARLAAASKAKRVNERTNPAYKWAALAIFLLGLAAGIYGLFSLVTNRGDWGGYLTLIGFALVFFFASSNVLPTARNNRKAILAQLAAARAEAETCLAQYPGAFSLPARYAHPIVLARMERVVLEGRAADAGEALDVVKADLKALNNTVQVTQEEYDEVVTVKPMFLIENYA